MQAGIPRLLSVSVALLLTMQAAARAERHMMEPRVPTDKLAEARALISPLPNSAETIEKGRGLYQGRGTCFNCHGIAGDGDGPASAGLDPAPRNFHHHGFWRHRKEGELFWVIKHGSPGTSMIGFGGVLSDEEIWALIQYERTFARRHNGGGMPGRGGRGPDGMDGMEHQGLRGGPNGCQGEACGQ